MGFSRQEYWSGLPFPSPGDLPDPGIEPGSPTFQADALTSELPGNPSQLYSGSDKQIQGIRSDRVHEDLWTEIPDIVQEAVIKTIPKKKKCQKAKWLSEEALQIAEKRRDMKGKGEKQRYTHLNAEFQRIARREKKAFLSDQCKEREENNRMGNTRDLLKKIKDTKGTFHAKMGTIKDRNGMNLREAEDIKKRWHNTQKNYTKKIFMTQMTTMVWSLT